MFVCIYSMFVLSCVSSGLVMADLQTKDLYWLTVWSINCKTEAKVHHGL
jgi:hypothetical protein